MYKIENGVCIFPLAFEVFYNNEINRNYSMKYTQQYSLYECDLYALVDEIDKVDSRIPVFIDFENIGSCLSRVWGVLEKFKREIYLVNLKGIVKEKVKDDIRSLRWISKDCEIAVVNAENEEDIDKYIQMYKNGFLGYAKKHSIEIVKRLIDDEEKEPQILDSSGLYSNMYINIKKLFYDVHEYYYIIFNLADLVYKLGEFDAFVSSSKNGSVIASILGDMFSKKVINIAGIGPKYSMTVGKNENYIRKDKRYIYIYDFICTGTEFKILNALINAFGANIVGGVGIAQYHNYMEQNNIFSRIYSLVNVLEAGINYKLAGTKQDMNLLLEQEGKLQNGDKSGV